MNDNTHQMQADNPLAAALRRILTPIARLLIARGVRFQAASEWLKEAYLTAGARVAQAPRLTDSRLSVLTGLQRKDIKAIRTRLIDRQPTDRTMGPIPRLIQNWRGVAQFRQGDAPQTLPRTAPDGPSFETLAATVSTDIHPRTLLEEMKRLDLVREEDNQITLLVDAYVPGGDTAALYTYLGGNLGDHAEAAVTNIMDQPDPPYFERAVHYNGLDPAALDELSALASRLQQQTLEQIAARAAQLQDSADPGATGRFRCGAFVYAPRPGQEETV